jgi:tetratricopeptide (TPR) repeat protein
MPRIRPTTLTQQHQQLGQLWHDWREGSSAGQYGFIHGIGHGLAAKDTAHVRAGLTDIAYFVALWQRPHARWRLYLYWRWLNDPEGMVRAYTDTLPNELGTTAQEQIDMVGQWLAVVGFIDSFGLGEAAQEQLVRCAALGEGLSLVDEARISILNQQGVTAQRRGELAAAAEHYEQAFAIQPAAVVAANLGSLCFTMGQGKAACDWLERAIDLAGDPVTRAQYSSDLATVREELGDDETALELYREALSAMRDGLGGVDPAVARTEANLGRLLCLIGSQEEGLQLLRSSHRTRMALFGSEHIESANAANLLGLTLLELKDIEAAEPLLNQALRIRRAVLGGDHPDTATSINNLALLAFRKGDYATAAEAFQQAVDVYAKLVGEEHPLCQQLAANRDAALGKVGE